MVVCALMVKMSVRRCERVCACVREKTCVCEREREKRYAVGARGGGRARSKAGQIRSKIG